MMDPVDPVALRRLVEIWQRRVTARRAHHDGGWMEPTTALIQHAGTEMLEDCAEQLAALAGSAVPQPQKRQFAPGMNESDHLATCAILTTRDGWDADCTCGWKGRAGSAVPTPSSERKRIIANAKRRKLAKRSAVPSQWNCPYCGYGEYKNRDDWERRVAGHLDECPQKPVAVPSQERLYHEIACSSLTKTGPCDCTPVMVCSK